MNITWLLPALLVPFFNTTCNFVDKYVVEKEVKDYIGMPIYGTIFGLVMGCIFWVTTGFPILSLKDTVVLLFSGALSIWSAVLYYKALSIEEPSRIILLFQTMPVFVLTMSYLFIGEVITISQFWGFLLILTSVLGVSEKPKEKGIQISKSFWLITIINILGALSAVLVKHTITENSFSEILSYESWGLGVGGILLYIFFPSIRNGFKKSIKTLRKGIIALIFANEGIFVIAKSLTYFAYSLGPTSLVSIVGSTQVFVGIFAGYLVSKFAPHLVEEDISRKTIIRKLIFAFILFLGLVLVY